MWSHPDSIKLLNSFSTVFICDTTYKMNKYHLPLLEIVGVTSIKMTFSVAFAYLQFERMDNFEWALNKVKGLFVKDDVLLYVIVIGRDLVLISALKVVLPFSTNQLCEFHISKNVRAKYKMLMTKAKNWEAMMDAQVGLVNSINEQIYEQQLKSFTNMCTFYQAFQEYVYYT